MKKNKHLSTRIISLALTVAMVTTMLPATVFATEGDGNLSLGASSIKAFDKLEDRFIPSATDASVYSLGVPLDTPYEDLKLPTELTATVERTSTVSTPVEDEVKDSGDVITDDSIPSENESTDVTPVEDEVKAFSTDATLNTEESDDTTVSGNQPATPSDAEKDTADENTDKVETPAPKEEPEQVETTVTTTTQESIPVTWKGDRAYTSDQNSNVIYTPVLPEGYAVADGTKLPQIYVMVGKQARAAQITVTTLSQLTNALYSNTDVDIKLGANINGIGHIRFGYGYSNNITLDLAGYTIRRVDNADVAVFFIDFESSGVMTVTDSSAGKTGKIINEKNTNTATALSNDGGGTLNINGGTFEAYGNAIANQDGTLNVSGGVIRNIVGSSKPYMCGAIWNSYENTTGSVNISGGLIENIGTGPAILNVSPQPLNITGGTVKGNSGPAISHRTSGVVTIDGASTIVTSNNSLTSCDNSITYAGTIYMYEATNLKKSLILKAGKVSNTTSDGYSVYFASSKVTANNVEDCYSKSTNATVGKIYPSPIVHELIFDTRNGTTIPNMKINSSMTLPTPEPWNGYTFDGWYSGINGTDAETNPAFTGKLTAEVAMTITANTTTVYANWIKGVTTATTWSELQAAMNVGGEIVLGNDITASSKDTRLQVPLNVAVTLDLNGKTLNRDMTVSSNWGNVIYVKGSLTINDSSGNDGKITGGYSGQGGGILVEGTYPITDGNGVLIINGGTITGNRADHMGAGISLYRGTKGVMNGGIITENSQIGTNSNGGGGIYSETSTFTMYGGSIIKNTAETDGGGITGHNISLYGGVISQNHANGKGGGVCEYNSSPQVGGTIKVIDNTQGTTPIKSNYLLGDYKYFNITEPFQAGASIGVTTRTAPTSATKITSNGTVTDMAYFSSDVSDYQIIYQYNAIYMSAKKTPSITIGTQATAVTYGTVTNPTYTVTSSDFGGGNPTFTPSVEWIGTAPIGVTTSFSADNATLTITTATKTKAGEYKFKVVSPKADGGYYESNEATLTVDKRVLDVSWMRSYKFPYTGASQVPYPEVSNDVQGDDIEFYVSGAKRNPGTYTATIVELMGEDAENYDATAAIGSTVKFTIL